MVVLLLTLMAVGLGSVTMLPSEMLPWYVHKACFLGYSAGCASAPFSILFSAFSGLCALMARRLCRSLPGVNNP